MCWRVCHVVACVWVAKVCVRQHAICRAWMNRIRSFFCFKAISESVCVCFCSHGKLITRARWCSITHGSGDCKQSQPILWPARQAARSMADAVDWKLRDMCGWYRGPSIFVGDSGQYEQSWKRWVARIDSCAPVLYRPLFPPIQLWAWQTRLLNKDTYCTYMYIDIW